VVGQFALELKKVDKELMIVRGARAKLSAKDKKLSLQGMDETDLVQAVFNYGECSIVIERNSKISRFPEINLAEALQYSLFKTEPIDYF